MLTDLLRNNVREYQTYPLLRYENQVITNVEAYELSKKFAQVLTNRGVNKHDKVIVCMNNCPEVILAYQGIWQAQAVVIPVMHLLHPKEIHYIAEDAQVTSIVTTPKILPKILQSIQGLKYRPTIFVVNHDEGLNFGEEEHVYDFYDEVLSAEVAYQAVTSSDSNLAVILYTSGTTGKPKGVMLSHQNIETVATSGAELLAEVSGDESVIVLPLAHSFGLTSMNRALILGNRLNILSKFDEESLCQVIEAQKVSHLYLVPAMIQRLLRYEDSEKYDLSSLKLVISGSASLPVNVIQPFMKKFDLLVLEGYGLSEAGPAVSSNRPHLPIKIGSVGPPLPHIMTEIVNEHGEVLSSGEVGELIVKGKNIMLGYFNNAEATRKALKAGWLYTGDYAKKDEDGYIYIVSRKKELIIRGGFNIYPRDLEELILTHVAVQDVAVIGVPSKQMGEEILAVVESNPGYDVTEDELMVYCQEKLAKYKTPRKIIFVDELPRNNLNKVVKNELYQQIKKDFDLSQIGS